MVAIEINFLTGRYVATAHNDRNRPEWPPHPARMFSALVAAWAESEQPSAEQRQVLELIEGLDPPAIAASAATERSVVTHYVPINDPTVVGDQTRRLDRLEDAIRLREESESGSRAALRAERAIAKERDVSGLIARVGNTSASTATELLPVARGRQARTYPSVTPDNPIVTMWWPDAGLNDEQRGALDGLLASVTRLGHSSSLVSCRVVDSPGSVTHEPDREGTKRLRWVGAGQLEALERAFAHHRGSRPRTMPSRGVSYRDLAAQPRPDPSAPISEQAGEWFVIQFDPGARNVPLTSTVHVTQALRGALLRHGDDPAPEQVSGHTVDDRPTSKPHLSFLALPHVGREHASGRVMGAAVMLPRLDLLDDPDDVRQAVLRALGRWLKAGGELRLGRSGVPRSADLIAGGVGDLHSLRRSTWEGAARRWVSVTPLALPWHPGKLHDPNVWVRAEDSVRKACAHVGLPEPPHVSVGAAALLAGTRPARDFPAFYQGGRNGSQRVARRLVHAGLEFENPVAGPLALGSGRFFGLGLMRPMSDRDG